MKYLEMWRTGMTDSKHTNIEAEAGTWADRLKKAHTESCIRIYTIHTRSKKIYTPVTAVDMASLPTAFKNNDWAQTVFLESIDTHTPCSSPSPHTLFIPLLC